jgi:hypothetical protein
LNVPGHHDRRPLVISVWLRRNSGPSKARSDSGSSCMPSAVPDAHIGERHRDGAADLALPGLRLGQPAFGRTRRAELHAFRVSGSRSSGRASRRLEFRGSPSNQELSGAISVRQASGHGGTTAPAERAAYNTRLHPDPRFRIQVRVFPDASAGRAPYRSRRCG